LPYWSLATERVSSGREAEKEKHTINERNSGTIRAPFAHAIKVSIEKFVPAYFKTFLDNFGCVLIHAILSGIVNNGINGSRAVKRRPVLASLGLEI